MPDNLAVAGGRSKRSVLILLEIQFATNFQTARPACSELPTRLGGLGSLFSQFAAV
jgi:hypothetical protein